VALSPEQLAILRCPACMRDYVDESERARRGMMALVDDVWLACPDCGRRYPVQNDIPVMMIKDGEANRT
jgi:hypothetical protein